MQQNRGQQPQVSNHRRRYRPLVTEASCRGLELLEHPIDTLS
jgi:hypothetical protein